MCSERVKPEIVAVHTTTNITTVQWEFQLEDQEKVKMFTLSCRDVQGRPVDIEEVPSAMKNVRDFKNAFLVPDKVYMITVLAVYEDGFKSESDVCRFTSLCKYNTEPHAIKHITYALFFSSWVSQ